MKTPLSIVLILSLFECGNAHGDHFSVSEGRPVEEIAGINDSIRSAIMAAIDDITTEATYRTAYNLSSDFFGFESSNNVSYNFDSLYNLTYCVIDWNLEGSSGSAAYYFENGELIAGTEQDYHGDTENDLVFHKGFGPVCGYLMVTEPGSVAKVTDFTQKELNNKQTELLNNLKAMLETIKQNIDSVAVDEFTATLHSETTANYGEDFTSTHDYTMDVAIFNRFINK